MRERERKRERQRDRGGEGENNVSDGRIAFRSIDAEAFFIVSKSTAADGPKLRDAKRESCMPCRPAAVGASLQG
jgi:hypothetical protein